MGMNNIKLFNCYAARIMAFLYESFPVKQHFHISDFVGKCELKAISEDLDHEAIACNTLVFLKENGFVDYSGGDNMNCLFSQVTLTTKGLSVLSQPMPESITEKKTLGENLTEVAKETGTNAMTDVITTAMVSSLKMFG